MRISEMDYSITILWISLFAFKSIDYFIKITLMASSVDPDQTSSTGSILSRLTDLIFKFNMTKSNTISLLEILITTGLYICLQIQ